MDYFDSVRSSTTETKQARTIITMYIGSMKYKLNPNLCYVCNKYPNHGECPLCHHNFCVYCHAECSQCKRDCCTHCLNKIYSPDGDYFICYKCCAHCV